MKKYLLILLGLLSLTCCMQQTTEESPYVLWYEQPATEWTDALPIGNGRIGGMLFGDPRMERLQVNEESLWGGFKYPNDNPGALENLDAIRKLIIEGRIPEAFEMAEKHIAGIPGKLRSYQVLADIFFEFTDTLSPVSAYRRSLDLASGIHRVEFKKGEASVEYELFASAPDDVLVLKMRSDREGPLDMKIHMARGQDARFYVRNQEIVMEGQIMDQEDPALGPGGAHMRFASVLSPVYFDGDIQAEDDQLVLSGGKELVLLFSAATDYITRGLNFDPSIDPLKTTDQILARASEIPVNTLKEKHIEDHTTIFNRVSFSLGQDNSLDSVPTNKRLEAFQNGADDPGLITQYFQYGRYLLMGCSRSPAQLPSNLQGIWNKDLWAPWGSDYHVNINIQMNYWPAEVCNLSETVEPLIDFVEELTVPGSVTARNVYGAKGWTMHHTTDVFGKTSVLDGVYWGMFPLGGVWMTFPLWRHFEFTNDTAYLRDQAYPIMKGASEFLQTFLFEAPSGYLVTAPSYSPENSYVDPVSGKEFKLTYAPTMDIQIIREVFKNTCQAASTLGVNEDFCALLRETESKLPPIRIGSDGTIMEWIEDYEEFEPGHRHISHLLGLHPGTQITPEDEDLFQAAGKTLERRLAHGGGHTGWSRAWIINFYARLLDGEACYNHLRLLLEKSTLPNLFDTHPPFQIDGNFGGTAGIAEMLLQSHNGIIRILPALPDAWPEGNIHGLKARGNFEVDMDWENGEMSQVSVKSLDGAPLKLQYGDVIFETETKVGEVIRFGPDLQGID